MKIWYVLWIFPLMISSCRSDKKHEISAGTDPSSIRLFEIRKPEQTGIHFENRLTEGVEHNSVNDLYFYNGSGLSIADFNNDGLQDIYYVSAQQANALYLNRGDMQFQDVSDASGTADSTGFQTGVTTVDINSDGWMDLYLSVSGLYTERHLRKNRLYVNQGPDQHGVPVFKEDAHSYQLDIDMYSTQASFFDYDLDGDLDMILANHHQIDYPFQELEKYLETESTVTGDRLYQNQDGKFVDVSREAGLINNMIRCILGIAVSDVNNDGWPDMYVSNDFTGKDELYLNNRDGTFTPSIHQSFKHISYASMGNDLVDFNNDGWTDLFTLDMTAEDNFSIKASMGSMNELLYTTLVGLGQHQQYMYNTLQLNNGVSSANNHVPLFSDIAQITGISNTDWSWAPLVFDMDNDGLKDLFVANGIKGDLINVDYLSYRNRMFVDYNEGKVDENEYFTNILDQLPHRKKSDYFFWNRGDLTFERMNDSWVDELLTCSNGTAYADLDNDGDLDIAINNSGGPSIIYENQASNNNTGNYLQFKLQGPPGNQVGIGTRIILNEGSRTQMAEQYLTRGFQSSVSPVLHFGVGEVTTIPEVEVIWPDGKSQMLQDLQVNQTVTITYDATDQKRTLTSASELPFVDVTQSMNVLHRHEENDFNDYERESLIPHRMSTLGPALAVGDVNNDGLDDFFIGGAIGSPGQLFLQSDDGFIKSGSLPWSSDRSYEDMNAAFFDADSDGDLDLYVVSGGNEYDQGSPNLQDRIYVNHGNGSFKRDPAALPEIRVSGSCVKPGDYDGDGDMDLFVGGRQKPGLYPVPVSSYILRNESQNGTLQFKDVTSELAPVLNEIGMVTDAIWMDHDGSGSPDLVLVGEWMSIRILQNGESGFKDITSESGLAEDVGWWNCIVAEDFDGDGDLDMVAGNLGLNYKYKASSENPFEVYAKDFDNNGTFDIVLGYYDSETLYPVRGRTCSSNQLPFIKQKFPTYNSFAASSLTDVYGIENLETSLNYKATNFASSYVENLGNGKYQLKPLVNQAQISSVNSIIPIDMDLDGNLDLILGGNLFGSEAETPRNDASIGLYLKGDGKGGFNPLPAVESGLYMDGDVKNISPIILGNKRSTGLISARNNDYLQLLKIN
ncbi:MAG: VCBS repeat-containing protein [Bacteroidota bacterium]